MGLVQFLRVIWARRYVLFLTTIACLMGAVFIAKLLPPRYEARSRVMLDIIKPDPVTGEVIQSGFMRAYVKTQTELIKDYRIAGKVVDDLGWTSSPVLAQAYAQRNPSDKRDFRRWLAQRIIDNTDASLIDTSNILEIRFNSTSPDAAAKVADSIRQAYADQALAFRRDSALASATWFKQQAVRVRAELTAAEKRKADFERANGIVLTSDNSDADTARLTALASTAQAPVTAQVGGAAGSSAQLEQANAAIASAEKVLGPNNPELLSLRRQRDAIAASAAAAARSQAHSVTTGPSLASQYSAQQAKVLAQRGKVSEAQQLATDVTVLRDQYQKTTARAAELEQQGASTETGLTLLGSAVAPESPVFPKWPLVIFGSLALGLALGLLVSLVIELLARRVRGIEDLQFGDVPVLGVMAHGGGTVAQSVPWWRRILPGSLAPQGA